MRGALLIGTLVLASCAAWADQACAPHVEEHPGWHSASFRAHTDAYKHCPVSEGAYRVVVAGWLKARHETGPSLTSLSLGRAVDFPWLSEYLARAALADPRWDGLHGRLRGGDLNAWVASLLSDPLLLERLRVPFEGTAYRVTRVSVEKVLVGPVENFLPRGAPTGLRAPFDAQLWLVLTPTAGPGREAGPADRESTDQ